MVEEQFELGDMKGMLRISEPSGVRRTAGGFGKLILENAPVFESHFGAALFPGSLNVDVPDPPTLQQDLDARRPPPDFVIPRGELIGMPDYIGDGQAWRCMLDGEKFSEPIDCWVFRRIGSRVPLGGLEIVAPEGLVDKHGLRDGDPVTIKFLG